MKKQRLFITVFTNMHRVKPGRPIEPILFTWALLMGALRVTPAESANCIYSNELAQGRANFLYQRAALTIQEWLRASA